MKFGQNYHKHQVAEWADEYMNYASFKRLCKEPAASANLPEIAARCMGALSTIDQFYCKNYTSLLSKLSFKSRLADPNHDIHASFIGSFDGYGLNYGDLQHQKAAFGDLVTEFDKLRWFGRVNTDGFQNIIRKIRSLGTYGNIHAAQVQKALCGLQFATQAQCLRVLENLQKIVTMITQAQQNFLREPSEVPNTFCIRLAKINPSIPALLFFRFVEEDDSLGLGKLIDETCKGDLAFSRNDFLYVLFQCSFRYPQYSWVDVLISNAISSGTVTVIENCVRYVIDELCWSTSKSQKTNLSGYRSSLSLFIYMLDSLLARKIEVLYKVDNLGRIPLHYACECDLPEVCRITLRSMKAWEQLGAGNTKSAIFIKDVQSRSPIFISVLSGHLEVSKILIHFMGPQNSGDLGALHPSFKAAFSELLLFAIKSDFTEAVAYFSKLDMDVNRSDFSGQTPLYLAARTGNEALVRLLLLYKPIVDKPETTKNWTPLIVASLAGFTSIVELLLEHGANIEHRDHAGWTAIDHASYRGHIPLAKALSKAAADLSHKQAAELQRQLKSSLERKSLARGQPRHSFPASESLIIINLGSLDSSNAAPSVCLSPLLIQSPSIIHPQSLFSLRLSMLGTAKPTFTTSLPLLADTTNKPWIFTTVEPTEAKIVFEIFRSGAVNIEGHELVGRGIALLDSFKRSEATKRESLSRDFTVPILSTVGLEYIGAVIFSFIISTPLVLPITPIINTELLWFEKGPSKVVGHRGSGQNLLPATKLQIGENTMQSYLSAVQLGASYVELDVQLTKDHTPVIYHDFLVSETGIDSPMYTVTNEQFMHINNEQSSQRRSPHLCEAEAELSKTPLNRRVRSFSMNTKESVQKNTLISRMKHTFDYNSRGCKGNTRGDFIHDSFVTLEQLLRSLPSNIALNIEIKYPMLSEATVDWKMDPFFIEANFFTDTILLCLAKHISTRAILLSSFSPEICILLACKQSRWPVVFGTDSGNWQSTDVRAANLQEAVSFAKKWELDGVVLASEPFVFAPQLVRFVKEEKGMVCATYGALNDEVEGVIIQAMSGVDILIVNNVRMVSETLAKLEHT